MLTDITSQFDHMIARVEQSEILNDPWPHMFVTEVIKPHDYRKFVEFENQEGLVEEYDPITGRTQYNVDTTKFTESEVRYFNKQANKFFHTVADKFGLTFHNQTVLPTSNFWIDTSELLIDDIHIDAFKDTGFTLSCLIYLPVDNSQKHYGSKLFVYNGDNLENDTIQDEGTLTPHIVKKDKEENFKCVRTLPFIPNCMFIAPNFEKTWHQAPKIAEGDVRKSLMMRWKV